MLLSFTFPFFFLSCAVHFTSQEGEKNKNPQDVLCSTSYVDKGFLLCDRSAEYVERGDLKTFHACFSFNYCSNFNQSEGPARTRKTYLHEVNWSSSRGFSITFVYFSTRVKYLKLAFRPSLIEIYDIPTRQRFAFQSPLIVDRVMLLCRFFHSTCEHAKEEHKNRNSTKTFEISEKISKT